MFCKIETKFHERFRQISFKIYFQISWCALNQLFSITVKENVAVLFTQYVLSDCVDSTESFETEQIRDLG